MAAPNAAKSSATPLRDIIARESEAQSLADRLPDLVLEAQRIAHTVTHGVHGRRRAGPGETFWQFRQLQAGDAAQLVDWRRSASSDHLYVREREWEAAHTVWLWSDVSKSMQFRSHLSAVTKRDRAVVLAFALGEMLVRGGERIGLLGLSQPSSSRKATLRLAEILASELVARPQQPSLPPTPERLSRFSSVVLVSDFLDPVETIEARIAKIAASGLSGHLIQVLDPAEETLPYEGRTEFLGLEDGTRWVAERVETLRGEYQRRLHAHRAAIAAAARKFGWTFLVHHTDRSAAEPLLSLIMLFQGGGDYRWNMTAPAAGTAGGQP